MKINSTELSQSTQQLSVIEDHVEGSQKEEGSERDINNTPVEASAEDGSSSAEEKDCVGVGESLIESESAVSSASDDGLCDDTPLNLDKTTEETKESATLPLSTPASKPKFVFGSAAKNLVTFDALAKKESHADFGTTEDKDLKDNWAATKANGNLFERELFQDHSNKVEIKTGEENEETKFSARAKLFEFDVSVKEWRERGVGTIKVNEDQVTGAARMLMRSEGVLRVLLNTPLSRGLQYYSVQDRGVRIIIAVEGKPCQYLVRLRTPEDANALLLEFATYCDSLNDI